jgi:membrane associated rhomboid family serine protease
MCVLSFMRRRIHACNAFVYLLKAHHVCVIIQLTQMTARFVLVNFAQKLCGWLGGVGVGWRVRERERERREREHIQQWVWVWVCVCMRVWGYSCVCENHLCV